MTIGYIYGNKKLTSEDRLFLKLARAQDMKVITFPSLNFMAPEMIHRKASRCDVVVNGSADTVATEIAKIAEQAGVPVVDPTRSFYYCEDKLMFYLLCTKHGIPTPKTVLLPLSLQKCRRPIKQLLNMTGSVVIKNVLADNGEFVGKAKDMDQALALVKRFRKRDLSPLIAQEYIYASKNVYRVMVLDGKVVQGIVKSSTHWKRTGEFVPGDAPVFHVPPALADMCIKIAKVTELPWCGIDLMRQGDTWLALEANSCPAMDFVKPDMKRLYEELVAYLARTVRARQEALRDAYATAIEEELPALVPSRTRQSRN